MNNLIALVTNECIKMFKKRRFLVVILILAVIISIFTYAQMRVVQNNIKQFGTIDWKAEQRQRIADWESRLASPRVPEEWKQNLRVNLQIATYYLEKDIDPASPNAVTFTREFVKNSVALFTPLIIMVIAADIVSSEHTTGTIKLLLTRPVRRWKILLSKLITLVLFTSLIVLSTAALCYGISGAVFGYSGWDMPVIIGLQTTGQEVDFSYARAVDQWLFIFMELGLVWYAGLVVALMTMMLSVLIRSTAAVMGTMLAVLISGGLLAAMASSWESSKYLFMLNLDLTSYLTGAMTPIPGMTLAFSLSVLSVWLIASLVVSFVTFTRKDVLN